MRQCGAALLMCAATFLTMPSPAQAEAPDTLYLSRQMLYDNEARQDAFSMLVPQGWKVESKFQWQLGRLDPVHPTVKVYNPNGVEAFHSFGGIWMFVDYSMLPLPVPEFSLRNNIVVHRMYSSPAHFVMNLAMKFMSSDLQRAKLVDVKELPELAAAVVAPYQANPGPQGAPTGRINRLRFEYTVNGVPVEEDVYCTILVSPHPQYGFVNWSANMISFRAAKGHMQDSMGLLRTIAASTRLTLPWYATIGSMQQQALALERLALDAERQRTAIVMEAARVTSETYRNSFEKQMAANTAINEGWDQIIRGVECKVDPISGHKMEVPLGYSHAWVNALGQTVLSNNANFSPGSGYQLLQAPR